MKVDQNTLLQKEGYTPVAGCEYEVGPGVVGKLKPITVSLQEKVVEMAKDKEDFDVMKTILDGVDDVEYKDCYYGMPSRVVADFFSLLMQIGTGLLNSSALLNPSQEEKSLETQES